MLVGIDTWDRTAGKCRYSTNVLKVSYILDTNRCKYLKYQVHCKDESTSSGKYLQHNFSTKYYDALEVLEVLKCTWCTLSSNTYSVHLCLKYKILLTVLSDDNELRALKSIDSDGRRLKGQEKLLFKPYVSFSKVFSCNEDIFCDNMQLATSKHLYTTVCTKTVMQ